MVIVLAAMIIQSQVSSLIQPPLGYVVQRADRPIQVSGRMDDPEWASAPWTEDFVDIEGDAKPKPRFRTRAKMLWDAQNLYIGADVEEPNVWGTLTEHDSVIFHDNDFEVFLDPDGDGHLYTELELNALNTTWDLLLVKPYRAGGPPVDGFELKGLKTAVHVDGTLNDPGSRDKGWTVEIAIPWTALTQIAGCDCPPNVGDHWRINFSRVEWRTKVADGKNVKVPNAGEDNWVWSPQHVVNMHLPERWGYIQFADGPSKLEPLKGWRDTQVLALVWEAERAYRDIHGRWAKTVEELNLKTKGVRIEATSNKLEIFYGDHSVDDSLKFRKVK